MLMVGLRVAVLALVVLSAAATVQAKTSKLAQQGDWEAFGGTTSNGRGVCGISSEQSGRYFGVKLFAGNSTFTIQLGTHPWQITSGEKLGAVMRFDDNSPWRATGTGMHFDDGDGGLEFTINRSELDRFGLEFRGGNQLRIQFEGLRFPEWLMSLQGTQAVNGAFQTCIRNLQ
jgi:hypothetical protein